MYACMALSAVSTLSVNPRLCPSLSRFRSNGFDEHPDGFGLVRRRRRNIFCALFARSRRSDVRAWVQAADAAGAPRFRTIGQLNEAIRGSDSVQKALKLLEDTKADGILAPNEATYASLMLLCRRLRQAERALVIYEAMKQAKEPISVRTYNTLLSCCQQSYRLEDALRIKKDLMEAGVVPDVVTFTTLMDIVVKTNPYRSRTTAAERLSRALELFKEMESYSISPDIKTFNTLIMAAAEANATDKALELYRSLVKAGLSPTDFTIELLLKCLGSGGRLKAAIQVYNEARAAGIALQARTYNFLISACAAAPQPQAKRAWSFFEEMLANKDVKPTAQTYISLITASGKEDDNEGVMKAFKLMKDYGLTQSITTAAYNQILGSASRTNSLDDTFKIFEEMKKAGHNPNSQTYECLMSACIRNKDFRRAEVVKEQFKDLDVSRNLSVCNSLIRAFGEAGKWDESLKIFRDMIKTGVKPNEASFATLFDACYPRSDIAALLTSETGKIEITPGLDAAISLYKEHKELLNNFSSDKLERLDVRNLTPPGIVVAITAWLELIRDKPPTTDLIVVTGSKKEEIEIPGTRPKRPPKKHIIAQRILRGFGLPVSRLDTLATLTLAIRAEGVKEWLQGPDPFTDEAFPSSSAGFESQAGSETEKEASTEIQKAAVEVHTSGRTQVVEVPVLDEAAELVVQIKKATAPVTQEQPELVVQVKKAETTGDD